MFVSVIVEPGGVDSAKYLSDILMQCGYTKVQKTCWENPRTSEKELSELKKLIDGHTDYYDKVRMYQFPIGGAFVVTDLSKKKWRRCVLKASPAASDRQH